MPREHVVKKCRCGLAMYEFKPGMYACLDNCDGPACCQSNIGSCRLCAAQAQTPVR